MLSSPSALVGFMHVHVKRMWMFMDVVVATDDLLYFLYNLYCIASQRIDFAICNWVENLLPV